LKLKNAWPGGGTSAREYRGTGFVDAGYAEDASAVDATGGEALRVATVVTGKHTPVEQRPGILPREVQFVPSGSGPLE